MTLSISHKTTSICDNHQRSSLHGTCYYSNSNDSPALVYVHQAIMDVYCDMVRAPVLDVAEDPVADEAAHVEEDEGQGRVEIVIAD